MTIVDQFALAIPVREADHVLGHAHAPVTLVEYGDFQCPHCRKAAPLVRLLVKKYPRRLRMVWRNFPLEEVHLNALLAAQAAEAAGGQARFWPMHDLIFENQAHLSPSRLREHAQRLELDLVRYDAEMKDTVYLQRVREDLDGGVRAGVRATPTFFLNGAVLDVSFGLEMLQRRVEEEVAACIPPG